jgi:hypothetical protein
MFMTQQSPSWLRGWQTKESNTKLHQKEEGITVQLRIQEFGKRGVRMETLPLLYRTPFRAERLSGEPKGTAMFLANTARTLQVGYVGQESYYTGVAP